VLGLGSEPGKEKPVSQRVLLYWFKKNWFFQELPQPWGIRKFLEQRGYVVELLSEFKFTTRWREEMRTIKKYDIFICALDGVYGWQGFEVMLWGFTKESERWNRRPRVFKVWLKPELWINKLLKTQKRLEAEWPAGSFGPPTEDVKELIARADKCLAEDERELLLRHETEGEILNRLSVFLETLPPLVPQSNWLT
jgi:hypothetical protein